MRPGVIGAVCLGAEDVVDIDGAVAIRDAGDACNVTLGNLRLHLFCWWPSPSGQWNVLWLGNGRSYGWAISLQWLSNTCFMAAT